MSTSDPKAADTLIAEAVLGILDPEEREDLGRELSGSVAMRRDYWEVEETLADLAGSLDTMQPSESLRSTVLAALHPASRFDGLFDRVARFFDLGADETRELLRSLEPDGSGSWTDDLVHRTRFLHLRGGPCRATAWSCSASSQPSLAWPHSPMITGSPRPRSAAGGGVGVSS